MTSTTRHALGRRPFESSGAPPKRRPLRGVHPRASPASVPGDGPRPDGDARSVAVDGSGNGALRGSRPRRFGFEGRGVGRPGRGHSGRNRRGRRIDRRRSGARRRRRQACARPFGDRSGTGPKSRECSGAAIECGRCGRTCAVPRRRAEPAGLRPFGQQNRERSQRTRVLRGSGPRGELRTTLRRPIGDGAAPSTTPDRPARSDGARSTRGHPARGKRSAEIMPPSSLPGGTPHGCRCGPAGADSTRCSPGLAA